MEEKGKGVGVSDLTETFHHTERLSSYQAQQRYVELLEQSFVVFEEADELDFLAKRLGKEIVWQHKVLVGGDAEPWRDGRKK